MYYIVYIFNFLIYYWFENEENLEYSYLLCVGVESVIGEYMYMFCVIQRGYREYLCVFIYFDFD